MKAIGIQIKSNVAVLVVAEMKGETIIQTSESTKITLDDHKDSVQIRQFRDQVKSAIDIIKPKRIGICARQAKGQMAGSPISFKLEGIIQLIEDNIEFVWPKTVSAWQSKIDEEIEADKKYQQEALNVAHYLLTT